MYQHICPTHFEYSLDTSNSIAYAFHPIDQSFLIIHSLSLPFQYLSINDESKRIFVELPETLEEGCEYVKKLEESKGIKYMKLAGGERNEYYLWVLEDGS